MIMSHPINHYLFHCSDEACTSGQLVIASRESQYKILHFHHAGLDKLAEVFQQWKCCRETQLKDQVSGCSPNVVGFYQDKLFSTSYSTVPPPQPPPTSPPFRPQWRSPACSSPSRGPPCRRRRPTRRRSCIGGWTSAPGCVTSTRTARWRRSISYARCLGDPQRLCHFESLRPHSFFPATFSSILRLPRPIFPCDSFQPSGFDGLQRPEMTQWQLHCDQDLFFSKHETTQTKGGYCTR